MIFWESSLATSELHKSLVFSPLINIILSPSIMVLVPPNFIPAKLPPKALCGISLKASEIPLSLSNSLYL
jgi:hypothetical protein